MSPQNKNEENSLEETLQSLNEALETSPDDAGLLLARGRLYWRMQRMPEAISDYEAALAADPDSPASIALEQARAVMNFYHKDLYNP